VTGGGEHPDWVHEMIAEGQRLKPENDRLVAQALQRSSEPKRVIPTTVTWDGGISVCTNGKWATEAESVAALDELLGRYSTLWTVYPECWGELLQPRYGQERKTLRIDRLIVPSSKLISFGWMYGAFGIEAKRSGEKVGPALAQAGDYGRSAWAIRGGIKIWPDWVFIWPLQHQAGTVASVMAQNRLGSVWSSWWWPLSFYSGESKVLRVGRDGRIDIGDGNTGLRTGSR
jgi:hypothetical protein